MITAAVAGFVGPLRNPFSLRWGSHVHSLNLGKSVVELDRWPAIDQVFVVRDPVMDCVTHRHVYRERALFRLQRATFEPVSGDVLLGGRPIAEGRSQPIGRVLTVGSVRSPRAWAQTPVVGLRSRTTYYHWMMEELPAALWARQVEPALSVLVGGRRRVHVKESLELLGFPSIFTDHPTEVEALLLPDRGSDYGWPHPASVEILRRNLLPLVTSLSRRDAIYVSRFGSKRAPNCAAALESLARDLGYKVLRLHEMPWKVQLKEFAHARRVVGQHGAGLANIALCAPDTEVVELMEAEYANPLYEVLSEHAGLAYHRELVDLEDIEAWKRALQV